MTPDCSIIVSSSHDQLLKTWHTTPRHPDKPDPPQVLSTTDTSALITWNSPPCFNLDVSAFHIQHRVGTKQKWFPESGISAAPVLRSRVMKDLLAATSYQFRICAENKMGLSDWSEPSKLACSFSIHNNMFHFNITLLFSHEKLYILQAHTEYGIPETFEQPLVCSVTLHSQFVCWFASNPQHVGSASQSYEVQHYGNGKVV
jgi:hypothetical protein